MLQKKSEENKVLHCFSLGGSWNEAIFELNFCRKEKYSQRKLIKNVKDKEKLKMVEEKTKHKQYVK